MFLQEANTDPTRFIIQAHAMAPILNAQVPLQAGDDDENGNNDQHPIEPQAIRVLVRNPDSGRLERYTVPQLTGTHLCGTLRRLLLGDLLNRIDVTRAQIAAAAAQHETVRVLYHTLYSGGTLGIAPALIPAFSADVEDQVRADWPWFSVLGAAVGQAPMPSKVRFAPLLPASTQLQALFPEELQALIVDTFDPSDALVRPDDDDRISNSRGADRTVPFPELFNKEQKKNPYRPMVVPAKGYIAAGTPLLGYVETLVPLTEVERGLLTHGLALLAQRGRLGGWHHLGFGAARITVTPAADPTPYLDWVARERKRLAAELTGAARPAWIADPIAAKALITAQRDKEKQEKEKQKQAKNKKGKQAPDTATTPDQPADPTDTEADA